MVQSADMVEVERETDALLLDNQLCYALYAAAHRMTKSYRPLLERLGLTYPQYLVLLVLWEQDGVTVSEIGRRLRLDSGTLTPVLKRLESAGFLLRTRRQSDEREVEIALTPEGAALRAEAVSVREAVMCQLELSEPEIRALSEGSGEPLRGESCDGLGTGLADQPPALSAVGGCPGRSRRAPSG
jgi:DNA-binding MarR family transcriptional regulator